MEEVLGALVAGWLARGRFKKDAANFEHRNKIINEIIETERFYIHSLETVVQLYLKPMHTVFPQIISTETSNLIFGKIEEILAINQELFVALTAGKTSNKVGQVFLKLAPALKLYSEYCKEYPNALTKLSRKMQEDRFFAFLKKVKDDHASINILDLPSLLIMPVQRIPRYKLLIIELLKRTPEEHEDFKYLQEALDSISDVADFINESIRERQNLEKILAIQRKLTGNCPPLVVPGRSFIREGLLNKVCRKVTKKRYFVLLSDAVIYGSVMETVGRYKFHRFMSLVSGKVKDVPDKSTVKNAFQLIGKEKSFTVFADTPAEKKSWVDSIEHALRLLSIHGGGTMSKRELSKALSSASFLEDEEDDDGGSAPVWVPDGEAGTCMACDAKFTTFKRRHHCRKCGKVVCGKCSDYNFKLDNLKKQARVCADCFNELSASAKAAANGQNGLDISAFSSSTLDLHALPEGSTALVSLTKLNNGQSSLRFKDDTQMVPKTKRLSRIDLFLHPLPPPPPQPSVPPPAPASSTNRSSFAVSTRYFNKGASSMHLNNTSNLEATV